MVGGGRGAGGGGGGGGQSHSLNFSVGSLGKGGSMHWLLVKTNLEEKFRQIGKIICKQSFSRNFLRDFCHPRKKKK